MSNNKVPKYKNMMYAQQLRHLPAKSVDNLIDLIENLNPAPKKYAVIIHDKDIDDNGKPEEPHVHAMLSFENARSLNNVASLLNDKPQYIEAWTRKEGNGFAYLVHATKKAQNKHQYDTSEVTANFDYAEELLKISAEVAKSKRGTKVQLLLDALYEGTISKSEVEERLTGSQYGRYHRQIESIWSKRLKNLAEQWKKDMIEHGKQITVIWIYGASGVGKTRLAKEYAKNAHQDYYFSGSSRDIFQNYAGQHTLILDELRPESITYGDLLKITTPFGAEEQIMAPSRYSDKSLACDLIIITTPFSPLSFYRKIFGYEISYPNSINGNNEDSFEQLLRRLTLVIGINEQYIQAVEYNPTFKDFFPVPSASKKNTYYNPQQFVATSETVDLFNSMFE